MRVLDNDVDNGDCNVHSDSVAVGSAVKEPDTLPMDRVLMFITAAQHEIGKVKTSNKEETEAITVLLERALIAAHNIVLSNKDLCKMQW